MQVSDTYVNAVATQREKVKNQTSAHSSND